MSDFNKLVADEFGAAHGQSLVHDFVLASLDDSTADQALARGIEPRVVWFALCEALEVPASRRWGKEPPKRRP